MTDIKVGDKVRYRLLASDVLLVTNVSDGYLLAVNGDDIRVRDWSTMFTVVEECLGWKPVLKDPEWWPSRQYDHVQIGEVHYWRCDGGEYPWRMAHKGGTFGDEAILALHRQYGSTLLHRVEGE